MPPYSADNPLRVCYFGTYRANYTRNQIVLKGLQSQPDVVVQVCHATLWQGIDDRVAQASGGWRHPRFWGRVAAAYRDLIAQHRRTDDYDVMLIGYPGQFDAFIGRLLAHGRGRPVALDILMSLHLVAEERGLTSQSPTTGQLIYQLERRGLRQPDMLVAENREYRDYIATKYSLPVGRFRLVPHGADETVYYPRPIQPPTDHFRVTYHGGYLPSHGMDAIIAAADRLRDQPEIVFHFFGAGPERERIVAMAEALTLPNVIFHGFVSLDELLDGIAQSHVCLGVFGTTRQSMFTVQNKVWETLALARPLISGDAPTIREFLTEGEDVLLVPRADGAALAGAILQLQANPTQREAMAQSGHQRFLASNSIQAIGRQMKEALIGLLNGEIA